MKAVYLSILLTALTVFSQSVVLTSPKGQPLFTGGDTTTISWSSSEGIAEVKVEYSVNNGLKWYSLSFVPNAGHQPATGSLLWKVPYLSSTSNQVRIKVTANGIVNPPSAVSDSAFTIIATGPDAYAPNNSIANAHGLLPGDTIHDAMVFCDWKTRAPEPDYFKFNAAAGNLINLSMFNIDSTTQVSSTPLMELLDSTGSLLTKGIFSLKYNVTKSSTFYCRVTTSGYYAIYSMTLSQESGGSLSLSSPRGYKTYSGGSIAPITWTSSGGISEVCINYTLDGGSNWYTIANHQPASGTVNWKVPRLYSSSNQVFLKVTALNVSNPPSAGSDSAITILRSAPDAYAPNNNMASAWTTSLSDTVKDAIVLTDWKSDTSEVDWYKFHAEAGSLISINIFNIDSTTQPGSSPRIELVDSTGLVLDRPAYLMNYNISNSGTYYCRVSTTALYAVYSLAFSQKDGGLLSITSPQAATFNGGQPITISWTSSGGIPGVKVEYALNGTDWLPIASYQPAAGSVKWVAPYLLSSCDQCLIKVTALNIGNPPFAVTQTLLTITAAAADKYEPNNGIASASSLAVSDTIRGAIVMQDWKSSAFDADYFKFSATEGNLISLRMFDIDSTTQPESTPYMVLIDSLGNLLDSSVYALNCNIPSTGTYYCKITTSAYYSAYSLTLSSLRLINADKLVVDSSKMTVTGESAYLSTLSSQKTDLSIKLRLHSKNSGALFTGILDPETPVVSPDSFVFQKAVSLVASSPIENAIQSADITIPYNKDSLVNAIEADLVAMWLDPSTNQWSPVSFTLDTLANVIIIHTTHLSVYGIFGNGGSNAKEVASPKSYRLGMTVFPVPANPSTSISFAVPSNGKVEISIYSVLGQHVATVFSQSVRAGVFQTSWNGKSASGSAVASGLYVAKLTFNNRQLQRKILLQK